MATLRNMAFTRNGHKGNEMEQTYIRREAIPATDSDEASVDDIETALMR